MDPLPLLRTLPFPLKLTFSMWRKGKNVLPCWSGEPGEGQSFATPLMNVVGSNTSLRCVSVQSADLLLNMWTEGGEALICVFKGSLDVGQM